MIATSDHVKFLNTGPTGHMVSSQFPKLFVLVPLKINKCNKQQLTALAATGLINHSSMKAGSSQMYLLFIITKTIQIK